MNDIVKKLLASTAAVALAAFGPTTFVSVALAQSPQGASVAAGSIAVTRQGATTVITQGTDRGIIDWRSFSIGAQEAVRFDQPGRSSVTLNRVTGVETSRIDGGLSATGQVWLSNPNGVLIGPSGQINVGGLLATTGRIDATEFLRSGRAAIDQIAKDAAIVNAGTINITEGGYAALAAASIRNEGIIAARAGSVALGSGKAMTVDFTGDKLITFQVNEALDQAVPGDTMISNGGTVSAAGGTVLMSARAAKGVMDNVVNLKGHVIANSVKVDGGTVSFGDGGIVQVSGKIDASNVMGKGGDVAVLGEKVGLMDGASIDASGSTGGGTVLVGGDWQGKGTVQNAQIAYVAPTASINVDATMAGDGGKAVVWADDTARFNGTISARGGVLAGNGGQVETSGKKTLGVGDSAIVTTASRALGAKTGSWLLDPYDVTISSGGSSPTPAQFQADYDPLSPDTIDVTSILTALNSGNVTILTTNTGSGGVGDIIVNTPINYSGAAANNTLTLEAFNDVKVANAIGSTSSAMNVKLLAGRDIIVSTGAAITTKGGSVTALANRQAAGGAIKVLANIETSGGAIVLAGGTNMTGAAPAVGRSGGPASGVMIPSLILIDAGAGGVTINGKALAGDAGVDIAGTVQMSGAGTISITGSTPVGTGGAVGVNIAPGAVVSSTGSGPIRITGDSANTGNFSHGVLVAGSVTQTVTGTGAISITGTRGGGSNSSNIALDSTAVLSTGSGSLSLVGSSQTGDSTTSNNYGVDLKGTLSTVDGAITVNGAGATVTTGTNNYGITIYSTTSVSATGTGSILLKALGRGASSTNHDIFDLSALPSAAINTASGDLILQVNLAKLDNFTSVTDAFKSTTGTIKLKPLSPSASIGFGANTGSAYFGAFMTNVLSGKLEIGDPGQSGEIKVANGWVFKNDTTFVTDIGNITFAGTVNGGFNVTAKTASTGIVSFAGVVGGSVELASFTRLGTSAKTIFGTGATQLKTTGLQSYSGPVELTEPTVTFNSSSGAVTFNGPVDSFSTTTANHSNLEVNASMGGVTFGNNFGLKTDQALKSFTSGAGTTVTLSGTDYETDGTQSYGGSVLLANNATIKADDAVTFDGTINTAPATGAKALTVNAVSVAFNTLTGTIGSGSALSSLTLSVTNNNDIVLPSLSVLNDLTVHTTGSGAITQPTGAMNVGNLATFTTTTGAVTLYNSSNNFNKLAVTIGSLGSAAILDSAGSLDITGANIGGVGGLTIKSTTLGTIIQTGAISAQSLYIIDANVVLLTNPSNSIGSLDATLTGATKSLDLKTSGSLAIGTVTASTATLGASSISGATNLDIATAPLTLAVTSGTLNNVKVNSQTGTAAAGFVTVTTAGGSVTVNGVALSGPPVAAPVDPNPTVATVATVASVATIATVASVPTVATVATVASVATVLTIPTTASVASVPTPSFVPPPSPLSGVSDPGAVTTILNQVLPPPPNFSLAVNTPLPDVQRPSGSNPSAQSLVNIVTATLPGAFIPPGAPFVIGTGAPLASAPTIKVDAADTGGANGQVIAIGSSGVVGGPGGPGGSGDRSVLPGLLSENRSPRGGPVAADPPLAQQPSTMNEEPFLD